MKKGKERAQKKKMWGEQGLLVFLEELKSISIMILAYLRRRAKDSQRTEGWRMGRRRRWRYESTSLGNTFTGLFLWIFHMNRWIKRAKDERGKGGKGGTLQGERCTQRGVNICFDTHSHNHTDEPPRNIITTHWNGNRWRNVFHLSPTSIYSQINSATADRSIV